MAYNYSLAIIILLLLTVFEYSHGNINCFICSANSIENCEKYQYSTKCPIEHMCKTIWYKEKLSSKQRKERVKKSCLKSNVHCLDECNFLVEELGVSNCKAECCHDDQCNKGSEEKQERSWVGNKRSNPSQANNAVSARSNYAGVLSVLLVISSVFFTLPGDVLAINNIRV